MIQILNDINVGIQSYCFRKFTLEKTALLLAQCGIDTLEISRIHLDVINTEVVPDIAMSVLADIGIQISAYGSNRLTNDEDKLRRIFGFAKRFGIKVLTADPDHDALDLISRLCDEYGIKVAIHNHGRDDMRHGRASMLKEILDTTANNIGVCLDTGWMIDAGDDPVAFADANMSRIYGIHLKDFSYDTSGIRHETLIGEGLLELESLLRILKVHDYTGNITIEYEKNPDDPVPDLKKCIENLITANSMI